MFDTWTRRRLVLGTGAVVAGTTGGIALASDNATATVEGDFSIPDGQTVLAGEELTDVRLSVNAEWGFSANAPMHALELELHVGAAADTLDLIARHTQEDLGTESLSGTETLSGSLMSASDFGIEDFRPSGGELRRSVTAELRLYVLRDGSVAAEAIQQTTFDVVVSDEEVSVELSLGGDGEVTFVSG